MEFTEDELRKYLQRRADELGSHKLLAQQLYITPGYMSEILSGGRGISSSVANAAGFKKVSVYRWQKKDGS